MSDLQQSLQEYGLFASPAVTLSDVDIQQLGLAEQATQLVLVGNRGSSYWPVFSRSEEFADGLADPLDRWSLRVAESICRLYPGYRAIFPSDGPPYMPFQRWALQSGNLSVSPLGLLIHPDYGLWHSFRFGLLSGADTANAPVSRAGCQSPCDGCPAKPCLSSCPVNAFTEQGYDFVACASYLKNNPQADCHDLGCQARNACPVGHAFRYDSAQHRFHLQAFIAAR